MFLKLKKLGSNKVGRARKAKMINKIKKSLPQIFAGLIIFLMAVSVLSIARAEETSQSLLEKVRICHRTNAVVNPYNSIEVFRSAVDGFGANDHTHHTGPIFDPETMENGDDWGDIIPPHPGNSLNWTAEGEEIWGNGCVVPSEEEIERLVLSAECSDQTGLSKWKVTNPNDFAIDFSYAVHLISDPNGPEENGTGSVGANSETIIETHMAGEVRITIYWDEEHACATNENVEEVCTPPVTDLCTNLEGIQTSLLPGVVRLDDGTCISYGVSSPKPTPRVLGTTAPQVEGEALPVSGANDYSLYYLGIMGFFGLTYLMKKVGWKHLSVK